MLKEYRGKFLLISDIWSTCTIPSAWCSRCCSLRPELGTDQCHSHHMARAPTHFLTAAYWLQNVCRSVFLTTSIFGASELHLQVPLGLPAEFSKLEEIETL